MQKDQIEALVALVIKAYGKIDILHNNAGILIPSPFTEIDLEKNYQATMDINVKNYIMLCQLGTPYMLKDGKGSIINTASVGAITGMPNYVTYSLSKAAVKHMTESMAMEYGRTGIRVNCICPGLTISEMVEEGSEFEKNILPQVSMGRAAHAIEMAYGALSLASVKSFCCAAVKQ